jgi:hypothetical protein
MKLLKAAMIAAALPLGASGFGAGAAKFGARCRHSPTRPRPGALWSTNDGCDGPRGEEGAYSSWAGNPSDLSIPLSLSAAPLRKAFVSNRSGDRVSMDSILGDGPNRERPTLVVFLRHLA